jgi:phenylacetate-CoA ligase
MLRRIPELTNEFQIVVNRGEDYVDGVSVRAEACYGDWAEIRERIQRDLRAVVGIRFDVELLQPGTLPRTMHKAKRVVELRKESSAACPT